MQLAKYLISGGLAKNRPNPALLFVQQFADFSTNKMSFFRIFNLQ
jgi:hypothetical protein